MVEKDTAEVTEKILELNRVRFYYQTGRERREVLSDVSFTLDRGEMVGLVGRSGSGKSTICKCIAGLQSEYQGEMICNARQVQMVFQDPFGSLNPAKTIGWILEEPLRVQRGYTKAERKEKVTAMIEKVKLNEEIYHRYPRELSGGQRQRVSIALALIADADLILMDEPLSALDVTVQAEIIRLIKELHQELRLTILFVSHDLDVVHAMCERILMIGTCV